MVTILLMLIMTYNMHAADTLNHEALFLRLVTENSPTAPAPVHNPENSNNRAETLSTLIKDKQERINEQWQECCCQAFTVGSASMIFGGALYPAALHMSIQEGLLLGAASSVPYCSILLCTHSYDHAKRNMELDDLKREYQRISPVLTMEE